MKCSEFVFWDVKKTLFEEMLLKEAKDPSSQKVRLHRLKASKFV